MYLVAEFPEGSLWFQLVTTIIHLSTHTRTQIYTHTRQKGVSSTDISGNYVTNQHVNFAMQTAKFDCVWVKSDYTIYMGSSSVVVLNGSHSLCNSFVVNQFFFFHTKWIKFPLLYTQEAMREIWWKKNVLFIFY